MVSAIFFVLQGGEVNVWVFYGESVGRYGIFFNSQDELIKKSSDRFIDNDNVTDKIIG